MLSNIMFVIVWILFLMFATATVAFLVYTVYEMMFEYTGKIRNWIKKRG